MPLIQACPLKEFSGQAFLSEVNQRVPTMIAQGPNLELIGLICQARQGDKAAIAELYERCKPALHWGTVDGLRYLYATENRHWEDYFQGDAALFFCEFVRAFDGSPGDFLTRLKFRVKDRMKTVAKSLVRSLKRERRFWKHSSGPCESQRLKELQLDVRAAVAQLSPKQREVIELELREMPTVEIAKALNITTQAVSARRVKAYKQLQPMLKHLLPVCDEGYSEREPKGYSGGSEERT